MKLVIQRVSRAKVTSEGQVLGSIGKGYMVLLGVGQGDTRALVDKYVDKMIKLRIFEDEQGKTNLSLADVNGEVLVVSQFTLYADSRKGNRPSFINAGAPALAEELYEYFLEKCREQLGKVASGSFGAEMAIELVNDGPFTLILDSDC